MYRYSILIAFHIPFTEIELGEEEFNDIQCLQKFASKRLKSVTEEMFSQRAKATKEHSRIGNKGKENKGKFYSGMGIGTLEQTPASHCSFFGKRDQMTAARTLEISEASKSSYRDTLTCNFISYIFD